MRWIGLALISSVAAAALALLLLVVTFNRIDISGEAEPSRIEKRLMPSLMEIKLRSVAPTNTPSLSGTAEDLDRGRQLYGQGCGFCHGEPNGNPAPFAKALSPRPPQFASSPAPGPTWKDAYVIRHGIRWTGMPAFSSLSEADAWRLALFVEAKATSLKKE